MTIQPNRTASFSLTEPKKENAPAVNGFSPKKEQEDLRVQSLQEQINSLRTKIQEVEENRDLDEKGKAELKQALRDQMTELTSQLQQRRLEVRQEKLDEEQKKAEEKNSSAANASSGKPNRDRFAKTDELHGLLSAMDSVKTAKIYQKAQTGKEQGARILKREAALDSRTFSRVEISGYRFTDLAERFAEEKGKDAPNEAIEQGELGAADEKGNFELGILRSPVFTKVFEKRSGAAIEEKLKNAALLTAEAKMAEKNGIKALSEADTDPDAELSPNLTART